MTSPSIVSITSSTSFFSGTTNLTLPASRVVGNLLLVVVNLDDATASITPPSGYNTLGVLRRFKYMNDPSSYGIFWRIIDGSESNPAFTMGAGGRYFIFQFSNVDPTNPIGNLSYNYGIHTVNGTKSTNPFQFQTTAPDSTILWLWGQYGADATVPSPPTGYTDSGVTSSFWKAAYKAFPTAGTLSDAIDITLNHTSDTDNLLIELRSQPRTISTRPHYAMFAPRSVDGTPGNPQNMTLTKPYWAREGDILVGLAQTSKNPPGGTPINITWPVGWTVIHSENNLDVQYSLAWKRVGAGEGDTTIQFNSGASFGDGFGVLLLLQDDGNQEAAPLSTNIIAGVGSSASLSGVVAQSDLGEVIGFGVKDWSGSSGTIAAPTGYAPIVAFNGGAGASGPSSFFKQDLTGIGDASDDISGWSINTTSIGYAAGLIEFGVASSDVSLAAAFDDEATFEAALLIVEPTLIEAAFLDEAVFTGDLQITGPIELAADFLDEAVFSPGLTTGNANALHADFVDDAVVGAVLQVDEAAPYVQCVVVSAG